MNDKELNDYLKVLEEIKDLYKEPVEVNEPVGELSAAKNSGLASEQEHYKGAVQPIQIMLMCFNQMEMMGFLKGNIIKYAFRAGRKPNEPFEKDMNKCKQYKKWLNEYKSEGKITL